MGITEKTKDIGWIQCSQCGWGCELDREEVELGDYVDRQSCPGCGLGPYRLDWHYPDGSGWVAGYTEIKVLHYDPQAVEEDVYPLRPIKVTWKVADGIMIYQHPGMIGRVELLGEGTPADPCRFSWSVAWTTGSGQPIFSGEEKNLESACKQVEYHFNPAVISAQVQSFIVKASE